MSVYPAGVKQYFKDQLTVADGKTTIINRPCVVKSISAAPCSSNQMPYASAVSIALEVYDGGDRIMSIAGSAIASFLVTNTSFLIPADGLRIENYLALTCKQYNAGSGTTTQNKHVNIKVDYQG